MGFQIFNIETERKFSKKLKKILEFTIGKTSFENFPIFLLEKH
jgi:hypothetical protein